MEGSVRDLVSAYSLIEPLTHIAGGDKVSLLH